MELKDFFRRYNKVALAFSGGTDSAYLMYEARNNGADIKAYFIKSQFQPEFELEDAKRLAKQLVVPLEVIECDVLSCHQVSKNPKDRCYYCKQKIFTELKKAADRDGYSCIIDGTNASDNSKERPGMKALAELKVLSPLKECGIDKERVRGESKIAKLFTWEKPSYACLATRIPEGRTITVEDLQKVENAEFRLSQLGFSDFRVRIIDRGARLQVREQQLYLVVEKRKEIIDILKEYFDMILLDLEERKHE